MYHIEKGDYVNKYQRYENNPISAFIYKSLGILCISFYFCDYYQTNAVDSDRALMIGAHSGGGSFAGLFYLASNYSIDITVGNAGTRLVYIP